MARRHYRPEEIINKLREAEVLLAEGMSVAEAAKAIGQCQSADTVTDASPHRLGSKAGTSTPSESSASGDGRAQSSSPAAQAKTSMAQ